MWFKIRFVQIGHVDLDEILITMNLLKTKQNTSIHCDSCFKKTLFQ